MLGLVVLPVRDPTAEMHGWPGVVSEIRRIAGEQATDTVLAEKYGLTGWLATYDSFDGGGLTILPVGDPQRYGFVTFPDPSEVTWPALLVLRHELDAPLKQETGQAPGLRGRLLESIFRTDGNGENADRLDVYLAERPEQGSFGGWTLNGKQ